MEENFWAKIVKANEKKIKKLMQKANWDALTRKDQRYSVYIDEDGDVWEHEDIAGGNSFPSSVYDGTAIGLQKYCYQYSNCNPAMEQKAYKQNFLDDNFEEIFRKLKCK